MSRDRLHLANDRFWNKFGSTCTRGSAYLNDGLFTGSELSRLFSKEETFDGFVSLLRKLNGFFAVVHSVKDATYVAVDHVRSFPLFYNVDETGAYVSDDAYWIRSQVANGSVDELSAVEFWLAGYVTGRDTLSSHVKQVQAGEALSFSTASGALSSSMYFDYGHEELTVDSSDQLLSELDNLLVEAFGRLVRWANGRTIVIPLSGGVDSRLVLLMLKRVGYDNVVSFSYGRRGNKESAISKKVASTLGIRWEFVPYSKEAWRKWRGSDEWAAYSQRANGLCSVPNIQEWPAVWELKKSQAIPVDSVFVPGHISTHTYYYPAVYPAKWLKSSVISEEELANDICDAFFHTENYWRGTEARSRYVEKAGRLLEANAPCSTEEATNYYRRWWWRELESKSTVNSVRDYDFWGYEWWLPLWDMHLAKFWGRVPLKLRFRKQLHKDYVKRIESQITKRRPIQNTSLSRPNLISLPGKMLRGLHLYNQAIRVHAFIQYHRHPYDWYGIVPRKEFFSTPIGARRNINSYVALQILRTAFPHWNPALLKSDKS